MSTASRIKELETELAGLRAGPPPEPTDGMDVIAALKYHYIQGWGDHNFLIPGFLIDHAVAEIERSRAAAPSGDRAKLIEELRVWMRPMDPNAEWRRQTGPTVFERAAAQIEADGIEIEHLRKNAIPSWQAAVDALMLEKKRLEAEVERLNVIIHGMQDGALVRDQAARLGRLGAENATLKQAIVNDGEWRKHLEAENEKLKAENAKLIVDALARMT